MSSPVSSLKKAEASRANARKSTGPRTAAGKAISRNNAYRHGMRARNPVAPGEDPAAFEARLAQFRDEFDPRTLIEDCLVQQIADASWRRDRLVGIESALLGQDDIDTVELDRISRWLVRVERSFFKAYTELRRLVQLRNKTEKSTPKFAASNPRRAAGPSVYSMDPAPKFAAPLTQSPPALHIVER